MSGERPWSAVLEGGGREKLSARLLAYARDKRWFRAKTRDPRAARLTDLIPLDAETLDGARLTAAIVEISYAAGEPDLYVVPLGFDAERAARTDADAGPPAAIAGAPAANDDGLVDALVTGAAATPLLEIARGGVTRRGQAGSLRGETSPLFDRVVGPTTPPPKVPRLEQTNSTILFGDRALLKVYRQLAAGPSPELEVGRYLTAACDPPCAPRVLGALAYQPDGGEARALGIVHELIPNDGDAWSLALRELGAYFARAAGPAPEAPSIAGGADWLAAAAATPRDQARRAVGRFFDHAATLGRRTGQLHLALARGASVAGSGPDFAPETLASSDRAAIAGRAQTMLDGTLAALGRGLPAGAATPETQRLADAVLGGGRRALGQILDDFRAQPLDAQKIRTHGDLHLGQILHRSDDDFTIIDFEGEPARPLAERRAKSSPLRDVMGMARSFDYAPEAALREAATAPRDAAALAGWARLWTREVTGSYLRAYLATVGDAPFIPHDRAQLARLLTIYEVEKVIYEVGYELDNRPGWVGIPLRGLAAIAAGGTGGAEKATT